LKIGFLIIDMQNIFLGDRMESLKVAGACEYINHVAGLLRQKNHCVVHIQDVEGMDDTNREKFAIIPEIEVEESDLRVQKLSSNAFWQTELEAILLNEGVKLVIVAGFAAEHCVLFTYNGALERGFKAVLLQNAILSTKPDIVPSMVRDRDVISYPIIEFIAES